MQPLRIFSIIPKLPPELDPLWFLAHNYWFAWNNDIEHLFSDIDPQLWEDSYKNPVWMLNHVSQDRYNALAEDAYFKNRLTMQVASLKRYLTMPSPFNFEDVPSGEPAIAYFSLEFGVSLCLPIYSGGLGILAGDHLKSASDLNVPLVGIGLAYAHGYFRQYMTPDGWQQERYPDYDFEQMPMQIATTPSGEPAMVHLSIGERPLAAQIWEAKVGRISLYLLDTNIAENSPELRGITSRLYGGNLEMRLWQEILLGIGGIKALQVLGLKPQVIHMNEGHSAFAGLERVRLLMKKNNLPFEVAVEVAASGSIFTTHTPVPAGNDRFPPSLMQQYFEPYARDMGLAFKVFLGLGRGDPRDDSEEFCMTVLALKLSRFNNGVSILHGKVSRSMWHTIWGQFPVDDVPIGSITNGVHAPTWVAPEMGGLYDRYLGSTWREDLDSTRIWGMAAGIPDVELWRTHERLRARLVDFVRMRLHAQLTAQGARAKELQVVESILDPTALTIGFARRFATYKRARLIMEDLESLKRVISDPERPVQFIFAGKAHPHDNEGKKLIQQLVELCAAPECRYHMVFLEDYDMEVASYMYQGCDVWLNTPRRPFEACGTSGMKAMMNGGLNFSTLDGWWAEAWTPDNALGFAIGLGEEYEEPQYQDFVESQILYNVLENEIIPLFYDRSHGNMPRAWIKKMKDSLKTLGPVFSSHRMVEDYAKAGYGPAIANYDRLVQGDFAAAKDLASWRMDMMTKWSSLAIRDVRGAQEQQVFVGEPIVVTAQINLNGIRPEDVRVEVYSGPVDLEGKFATRETTLMEPSAPTPDGWQEFTGKVMPVEAGRFGYTVRILPHHPLLLDPHSLGLIKWADS